MGCQASLPVGEVGAGEEWDFKRVLLVSDNLPLPEVLMRATLDNVLVVPVQYQSWDLARLTHEIKLRAGLPTHQFLSIGLLDHGMPGEFCLLKSVAGGSIDMKDWEDAVTADELTSFFKFLASYVQIPKELHKWRENTECRIDLMACDVAATAEGMKFITHLEDLTGVNWAASTNKTGAGKEAKNGFDWVMETEENLGLGSIATHYFVDSKIRKWKHVASMADDDEHTFETADSGASQTYPQQAGEIRKGSFLMIKGHPCKCVEVSTSKTGKHGHAKAHIVAIDIFTGKKLEDLCPTSHNLDVPFVNRTEYQLLSADKDTGEVSLLREDGSTKDDLNLPTFVSVGEPTEDDKKVTEEIITALTDKRVKSVHVIVQSACGMEKIYALKVELD